MGLRETLNEKPQIITAVAVGIIALSLLLILWQLLGRGSSPPASPNSPSRVFFTTDDGATLFVDDIARIPPFDHEGKPAVRAHVFTCDGGRTRFVGYLERFDPAVAARLAPTGTAPSAEDVSVIGTLQAAREVKRPGQSTWVPVRRPDLYTPIVDVTCPPGTPGPLETVLP